MTIMNKERSWLTLWKHGDLRSSWPLVDTTDASLSLVLVLLLRVYAGSVYNVCRSVLRIRERYGPTTIWWPWQDTIWRPLTVIEPSRIAKQKWKCDKKSLAEKKKVKMGKPQSKTVQEGSNNINIVEHLENNDLNHTAHEIKLWLLHKVL